MVEQRQLKNISLFGRRTDVEEIIDASDICTLFTNNERHAEGVSNFIMEAMAAQINRNRNRWRRYVSNY